jgi:tetratricopeptide (TPR) repeat protein
MTFHDINFGRVFQAVMFIFGVSIALYFLTSLAALAFVSQDMIDRLQDVSTEYSNFLSNPDNNGTAQDELETKLRDFFADYQGQILGMLALFCGQSVVMLGVTFWFARRAALQATSRAQANGYGVVIGLGVAVAVATICVLINPATLFFGIVFMAFIVMAALVGGWQAGQRLDRTAPPFEPGHAAGAMPPGMLAAPQGSDASVYFNMGVTAAMGGRREEARQHFRAVLQLQPRNVPAWLQLANLADSPAQAWEYIQQARAISPNDPAVVDAVNVIWPQVQGEVPGAPRAQPPYKGGAMDDTEIPRSTLPGPDETAPPEPDDDEPPAE